MEYSLDKNFLIFLRKVYNSLFKNSSLNRLDRETDFDKVSEIIYGYLIKEEPCMMTRFGAVEISAVTNYLSIKKEKHSVINYIKGNEVEWWWNEGIRDCMLNNAGFFPNDNKSLVDFCELMLNSIKHIDVLASWQPKEKYLLHYFKNASRIDYTSFDCFWAENPWTFALKGKNVLVVHPFTDEIKYQYHNNRNRLFSNSSLLPDFNLITVRAVQSIGGKSEFKSWFYALEYMKSLIDEVDYDICLLGCGAYGMPLAAHVKNRGKKAIHIGGSLQLLFGIKGKRWEDPFYGYDAHGKKGLYPALFNDYWIRPGSASQIQNMERVDNGCYW